MPRKVWVTTTRLQDPGGPTVAANIERARALLERACARRPDIICLPETVAYHGMRYENVADVAQTVPGPLTDMAAAVARTKSTYVICPLAEKRGEVIYNTAVLIDRQGRIAGTYEKVHPVPDGRYDLLEHGLVSGREPRVFDTDFGRIGILICFDINWRAEWQELKEKGAEIVFWPSAYEGGRPLQSRALDHHYYVVSAVQSLHSRIIDVSGQVLAETGPYNDIAEMEIDLEKRVFSTDYNMGKLPALLAKYGRDVGLQTCLDEDIFTLESYRADLTVADLVSEFGLEYWSDYIAKSTRAQAARRP